MPLNQRNQTNQKYIKVPNLSIVSLMQGKFFTHTHTCAHTHTPTNKQINKQTNFSFLKRIDPREAFKNYLL